MYGVTMLVSLCPSLTRRQLKLCDECWSFGGRLKMEAQSMIQRLQ